MPVQELLLDVQAPCVTISVGATASTSVPLPSRGETLRIVNEGTGTVFISVGDGTQTATVPGITPASTCTPVIPGDEVFRIASDRTLQISAITASGTATLRVQVTNGQ